MSPVAHFDAVILDIGGTLAAGVIGMPFAWLHLGGLLAAIEPRGR